MSIFKYLDYIKYMVFRVDSAAETYGYKSKLAEAAGCQKSYLSNVLQAKVHLTLEHALGVTRFFSLSPSERDYFLDLVQLARAATKELREFYLQRIQEARQRQENLSERHTDRQLVEETDAAVFYSHWLYNAVHVLLTIPEFREVEKIAQRLQVDTTAVALILKQLEKMGFAENRDVNTNSAVMPSAAVKREWHSTAKITHLAKNSQFITLHHSHWRRRAVDNAFLARDPDVHYTGVMSLSSEDVLAVQQMLLEFLDRARQRVVASNEEELYCLGLDWFRV